MSTYITRVERAAPIFARSGQLRWTERPLWYDVYVLHPPFEEPVWNITMPKSEEPVRKLFYAEDLDRAKRGSTKRAH